MARVFTRRQRWYGALADAAVVTCGGLGVSMAAGCAGAAKTQPSAPDTRSAATTAAAVTGFWNGTDSSNIGISGSAPYETPAIGGVYGGYIGMVGNWAVLAQCPGTQLVWSTTDSNAAKRNFATYHYGIGVGVYWFMGGPGVDPHYNGTTKEASIWGAAQAAAALSALNAATGSHKPNYPIIFMDVELPGQAPNFTPAPDNGWTSVYTSACSGVVRQSYVPASVNRAEFNAFSNFINTRSSYKAGVYSAPTIWRSIFGTGSNASIANTYEWTYKSATSNLAHRPNGWCLSGTSTCARFFGGMTSASKYAVMWQWSGGGGTYNGYGDFNQIDASRTP